MALTDACTYYLHSAFLNTRKDCYECTLNQEQQKLTKPRQSVIHLVKQIQGTNRNVTGDNWFSSIELVNELCDHGCTYVGNMKKNKVEIPKEFQPNANREVKSSLYGFTEDVTPLSFVPKEKKAVLMVSSMHHAARDDLDIWKPEIISLYNHTKGGLMVLTRRLPTTHLVDGPKDGPWQFFHNY